MDVNQGDRYWFHNVLNGLDVAILGNISSQYDFLKFEAFRFKIRKRAPLFKRTGSVWTENTV